MNSCQHRRFVIFVMTTEIYTIEGGQKDVSSLEGIHMKNLNCNATFSELVLFGHTRLDYFLF